MQGLTKAKAAEYLRRDGRNELKPPKKQSELVKFFKLLFGGFSVLLWIGAILCFFAYTIQAYSYEDVPGDNVSFSLWTFASLCLSACSCLYNNMLYYIYSQNAAKDDRMLTAVTQESENT